MVFFFRETGGCGRAKPWLHHGSTKRVVDQPPMHAAVDTLIAVLGLLAGFGACVGLAAAPVQRLSFVHAGACCVGHACGSRPFFAMILWSYVVVGLDRFVGVQSSNLGEGAVREGGG